MRAERLAGDIDAVSLSLWPGDILTGVLSCRKARCLPLDLADANPANNRQSLQSCKTTQHAQLPIVLAPEVGLRRSSPRSRRFFLLRSLFSRRRWLEVALGNGGELGSPSLPLSRTMGSTSFPAVLPR